MIRGSFAEILKGDHPWQKIFFEICRIFDESSYILCYYTCTGHSDLRGCDILCSFHVYMREVL